MSIAVVGSIGLDTIQTPAGRVNDVLGGSAAYFSLAARHFMPVSLVAVVGKDFPRDARSLLDQPDVDLAGLEVQDGKTFRWEGVYSDDMNTRETIRTELNVFEHFKPTSRSGSARSRTSSSRTSIPCFSATSWRSSTSRGWCSRTR
jgi:hypothetical protein